MNRFYVLIAFILCSTQIHAQAPNDDCETAIDITDQFTESDEFRYCFPGYETAYVTLGAFRVDLREANSGNINYNYISNDCEGYTDSTSSTYPDVWFK